MFISLTSEETAELARLKMMREEAIQEYNAFWSAKTPEERLEEWDRLLDEGDVQKMTYEMLGRLIMELDVMPETPEARVKWAAIAERKAAADRAAGNKTTPAGNSKI